MSSMPPVTVQVYADLGRKASRRLLDFLFEVTAQSPRDKSRKPLIYRGCIALHPAQSPRRCRPWSAGYAGMAVSVASPRGATRAGQDSSSSGHGFTMPPKVRIGKRGCLWAGVDFPAQGPHGCHGYFESGCGPWAGCGVDEEGSRALGSRQRPGPPAYPPPDPRVCSLNPPKVLTFKIPWSAAGLTPVELAETAGVTCGRSGRGRQPLYGRNYLRCAAVVGVTWPVSPELDDATLERKLFTPAFAQGSPRPQPEWARIHVELRRPGVTLLLLREEYRSFVRRSMGRPRGGASARGGDARPGPLGAGRGRVPPPPVRPPGRLLGRLGWLGPPPGYSPACRTGSSGLAWGRTPLVAPRVRVLGPRPGCGGAVAAREGASSGASLRGPGPGRCGCHRPPRPGLPRPRASLALCAVRERALSRLHPRFGSTPAATALAPFPFVSCVRPRRVRGRRPRDVPTRWEESLVGTESPCTCTCKCTLQSLCICIG